MKDGAPAATRQPRSAGEGGRFVRFCVAGVLGLAVDLAVLYLVAPWLGWYAGRGVSFLAAATTTWWVNRHAAFRDCAASGAARMAEYGRYIASMLVGGTVNYSTYLLALHAYAGSGSAALGVAAGSAAGLGVNYLGARWVAFRR